MRTREEIEKDIDALFVGGCQDRRTTFTELDYKVSMLQKYREELNELEALEKLEKTHNAKTKKLIINDIGSTDFKQ